VFLAVTLVFLFCDQLASLAKPYFHRFRPTHHPDFKYLVHTVFDYRGGSYGFFSGHATNAFGIATFLSLLFRNKILSVTMIIFAVITAYTRIYLGVHFISDVLVGAFVGTLIGYLVYGIYLFSRYKWLKNEKNGTRTLFSPWKSIFLCGVFIIHLTILLLFSNQLIKLFL
jgi:undecaprenyl-diphosphatase